MDSTAKISDVFQAVNQKFGWPAADADMDKLRLKGFEDKWEKALFKGKELLPQYTLEESGISDGDEITTIKIWLHAEGESVVFAASKSFYCYVLHKEGLMARDNNVPHPLHNRNFYSLCFGLARG